MHSPQRIAVRVTAALAPALLIAATAHPAFAETPSSWEITESYSAMDVLLIFVGIPLLLFVVIAVFGWLTHTSKALTYPIRSENDGGVKLTVGRDGEASQEQLPEA